MKSFSIKLFGITGAALMFSSMAFAQATCGTALVNTTVGFIRAEGQTELIPTFNFTCTNTTATVATASVQLFLSPTVTVTSSVTAGTSPATTEIQVNGAIAGGGTVGPFYGSVSGSNITISGVTVPTGGAVVTYSVNNVRVNATTIPTASGGAPSSLNATGFITGTNVTPQALAAAAAPLAYISNGLASTVISADAAANTNKFNTSATGQNSTSFGVCAGFNTSTTAGAAFANFYVRVGENFATSFKSKANETGLTTGVAAAADAPNSGTRIKVSFTNVPAGLNIYLPLTVSNNTVPVAPIITGVLTAQISETAATNGTANIQTAVTTPAQLVGVGAGVTLPAGNAVSGGTFQVPVSNGSASAIYEVTADNPSIIDNFIIPVFLQAGSNSIAPGTTSLTVAVSYAPVTAATTIPSFAVGTSTSAVGLITFNTCTTTLLFPFVSNAAGFETGIAISNTSTSAIPSTFLGTGVKVAAQSGTCNLAFWGTGGTNPTSVQAPNPNEGGTAPYASAESYAFTLTQALAANTANPATFTGFIIAQCNFQYAHGFAYITYGGLGTPNAVAMGYLASVLTRGTNASDTVQF